MKIKLHFLILVAMLACGVSSAWGQEETTPVPTPKFEIVRFDVAGNTLLKQEEVDKALSPYVGKQKDFADIQRALEALEEVYRERGYGVVQVILPEQDITRGIVQLRVSEPKIGKVIIEDNKYFPESNIRASLPLLKEGATPNSRAIAQNLQLLSEHPSKQTMVLLKSGAAENEIDATVKVTDDNPLRFFATLDNTGTKETGRERVGVGFQHSNLFNRDHVLNVQYVTSLTQPSDVKIFGVGYRIPFYAQSSSLDLIAGYSDVNSGTLQNLFNVSGSGSIYLARYNLYLPKIGEFEHKLALGADYKAFQNQVLLNNVGLVPDVTVHPASASYSGVWRMPSGELSFYASYFQNIPGGNDGSDSDFKAARIDATAGYRLWRTGATYVRTLPANWQLRAVLIGQYSPDALVPGEQFGFGGPDSVRGFNIREVSGDRGYSTNLEVYTPELGALMGWKDTRTRLLAFYDTGTTARNSAQPGESFGQSGGSVGFGLRVAYAKNASFRLDAAQVIDAAGAQVKHDQMIHASLVLSF